MTIAYLGMGANLGDPIQQLIDARRALGKLEGVSLLRSSSFYVTSPVGYKNQKDFVNCVVELHANIEVRKLFADMQAIEKANGRVRNPQNQNAARHIDIDLLLFGNHQLESSDLVLPHPRMQQRLFVLLPLAELNSELAIGQHGTIIELLDQGDFTGQQIMKLGS